MGRCCSSDLMIAIRRRKRCSPAGIAGHWLLRGNTRASSTTRIDRRSETWGCPTSSGLRRRPVRCFLRGCNAPGTPRNNPRSPGYSSWLAKRRVRKSKPKSPDQHDERERDAGNARVAVQDEAQGAPDEDSPRLTGMRIPSRTATRRNKPYLRRGSNRTTPQRPAPASPPSPPFVQMPASSQTEHSGIR